MLSNTTQLTSDEFRSDTQVSIASCNYLYVKNIYIYVCANVTALAKQRREINEKHGHIINKHKRDTVKEITLVQKCQE